MVFLNFNFYNIDLWKGYLLLHAIKNKHSYLQYIVFPALNSLKRVAAVIFICWLDKSPITLDLASNFISYDIYLPNKAFPQQVDMRDFPVLDELPLPERTIVVEKDLCSFIISS